MDNIESNKGSTSSLFVEEISYKCSSFYWDLLLTNNDNHGIVLSTRAPSENITLHSNQIF